MTLYLYHIVQVNDFKRISGDEHYPTGLDEVHIYSEEKVEELKKFWKDKKLYYRMHFYEEDAWYELTIDDIEFNKIIEVKSYLGPNYTDDPLINKLIGLLEHREEDQYYKSDVLSKLDLNTSRYVRECVKNELDQKYSLE